MTTIETDYEAIRQLFARFGQTHDWADDNGFAACFAPDGVFDTSFISGELAGEHRGHDALKAYVTGALAYSGGRMRHSPAQSLIELDGETARASSYVVITRDYGPPRVSGDLTHSELITTGMYWDELRKIGGRWLFARRVFRHDGLPDVLARIGKPLTVGPA